MRTLPSIDHIRRPTLDLRKRAEIYEHLMELTAALHAHDQDAVAWAQQRRQIFERIQHCLLYTSDAADE